MGKCSICRQPIRSDCDWNQGRCPHWKPMINIQPADPNKRHFYASLVKSITRLGACAALYTGDLQSAAIMFFAAEILGIAEELV